MSMGAATRGGDLLAHSLSLFLQNFRRAMLISVLVALVLFGALAARPTENNVAARHVLIQYAKGKMGIGIGSLIPGQQHLSLSVGWGHWQRSGEAGAVLEHIEAELLEPAKDVFRPYIWATAGVFFLSFCGVWFWFWRQGKAAVADKVLAGQKEVNNRALELVLEQFRVQPPRNIFEKMGLKKCAVDDRPGLMFGGFEVPPALVCRNLLVCGGIGAGKTTAQNETLDSLRRQKIKTVVYDPHSQFIQNYYRKGKDFILNPADIECVPWDVFSDIKDKTQLVSLIKMLIPADPKSGEDFFVKSARKLLADLMLYVRAKRLPISEVYRIASESTLQELYDILCSLKRSESKGDMDPQAAEQAQGIRSSLTASESVRFMELFPQSSTPFSIRKWMEKDEDSWLFITSHGTSSAIHAVILPYISTTFDIALQSVAGVESYSLRRAIIADELSSAGYLPSLEAYLSELRKWGVSILIGFQDINQILERYGENVTQSIITNCQTRLVMRTDNDQTAEMMGRLLGIQEVEEAQTGASWGADDMRDGESISKSKTQKSAIAAHKIINLPDLQGYLKIAGPFPVTKVTIKRKERKTIHPGYQPSPGLAWDIEGQEEHFRALENAKAQRGQEKAQNNEAAEQCEEEEF
jgi:hypothetical protein